MLFNRPLVSLAIATAVAVVPFILVSSSVSAHCPSTSGKTYAYGGLSSSVGADRIRADIEWVLPNVCQSGVSHAITIAYDSGSRMEAPASIVSTSMQFQWVLTLTGGRMIAIATTGDVPSTTILEFR